MPDAAKPTDQDNVAPKDKLAQDQLDTVAGGLNIGSATGGAGAGKMTFDDESPKEEIY